MICFRCGQTLSEGLAQCTNCGQVLGETRKVTRTVTSFRALELRRQRAQSVSDQHPYLVGDSVDNRYEIIEVIGAGPLGTVYRSKEIETGLVVALKAIHPSVGTVQDVGLSYADAFSMIGRHDSPDVLRVIPLKDAGRLLARSRFVSGLTLRRTIELRLKTGQPFELHEVGPRIFQLIRALEQLHPVAPHGFLKPENIILIPEGVRITDFGLRQALPADAFIAAQRDAGAFVYLAPELRDQGEADARSDVYSLGAILYELLSGRTYEQDAPSIAEARSEVDGARWHQTDELIRQATSQNPAQRFATASDFGDAFAVTMEAQALILGGDGQEAEVTVRISAAASEEVTRVKKFDRDETDSHSPVMVDPSLFEEQEASFDDISTSAIVDVEPEIQVIDDDSIVPIDDELDFDEGEPTGVDRVFRKSDPTAAPEEATRIGAAPAGPWFVRSNLGFMAAVGLILLAVALMGIYYMTLTRGQGPGSEGGVIVRVPDGPKPITVGAASDNDVTPSNSEASSQGGAQENTDRAAVGADSAKAVDPNLGEPKPAKKETSKPAAQPSARSVAPAKPKAKTTPRPAAKSEPKLAPKPEPKPAPKPEPKPEPKPAPKPEPKPAPKPEPKPAPKPEPKPAPKPEPKPAPKPEPPKAVSAAPAAPPAASVDETVTQSGTLSCPAGMRLITTAKFPSGSVRRGKIKGAKATGLARAGKAYCIDVYEYPGRGSTPQTRVSFAGADSLCKRAGKRLCSDREWQRGCRGKGGAAFPYGRSFRAGVCNTETDDGDEGLLGATGKFRKCRSGWRLYDMSGNAAEWTADKTVRGGDISSSDEDAACNAGGRRSPSTTSSTIGFRCCRSF